MARIIRYYADKQPLEKEVICDDCGRAVGYSYQDITTIRVNQRLEKVVECPSCLDKHYIILDDEVRKFKPLFNN